MKNYNPKKIESKWQKVWESKGIYKDYGRSKKFYCLDMFPYPSGSGLHVGHPKGYIATDVVSRFKMLQGYSVLHPMGWDAFGLPAENYAIKNKVHPKEAVAKNIEVFKKQLEKFGFTYDWDLEVNTTDPEYYKWTQWIFLKMFEKGLAYESDEPVNWCPSCKTVLANEDLEKGRCERCGSEVEQRPLKQWVLKMTEYADRLLYDLDTEDLDWEDMILNQQRNWIGRSEGVEIEFRVIPASEPESKEIPESSSGQALKQVQDDINISVFTTRVDTIFGCTYCVIAPEHKIIQSLRARIENYKEVEEYMTKAKNKTNLERTDLQKEKIGVEIKGLKIINPFNQEELPLFVADYVLGFYGTGAVMAVPAHDERDWEFAKKYNLPIKEVIVPQGMKITGSGAFIRNQKGSFIFQKRDHNTERYPGMIVPFGGSCEEGESPVDCLEREMREEIGAEVNGKIICSIGKFESRYYPKTFINIYFIDGVNSEQIKVSEGEGFVEMSLEEALKNEKVTDYTKEVIKYFQEAENFSYTEDGTLIDSEKYSGLTSKEAREKMTEWLEENKLGKKKVNYKMRDWVFSRQRYWGEPIPIVHCEKCGAVGVPESELPLRLPEVESYEPAGTGESPLANITEWVNTNCPKCGGPARRETNTMPQWAGSCWYYLAYLMRGISNFQFPISKYKKEFDKWLPVDLYVGGAEHATRHLLYARFWHKFLFDIGAVSTKEPFKKLVHVGLINGEDGRKMSKRWGNVINPDDVISEFGADAMRVFEMFMGPFTQEVAWSTAGVNGSKRFLEKVYKLQTKANDGRMDSNKNLENLLHKTIKKVTEDIENFRFNTAISALMILVNELDKQKEIPVIHYSLFLILLSPFAPHIAEELWEKLGHKESIFLQSWPKYDENLIKEEMIKLVIQVNGKVRDIVEVSADISEDEVKELALQSEKVKSFIVGKEIKKVIFVKGRLVNIVT